MKKLVLLAGLLVATLSGFCQQARIANNLQPLLESQKHANKFTRVVVVLQEQTDLNALRYEFSHQRTPAKSRSKQVHLALRETAKTSQQQLLKDIATFDAEHPGSYFDVETHWIVNLLVVSVRTDLLQMLAQHPGIKAIERIDAKRIKSILPIESHVSTSRVEGGTEPGQMAINAPAMWKMGYTGRGRLAYSFDTGVWPDHPAIGDRFMGKFYPLSQSYFSLDTDEIKDKSGTHGTHTLGTTLGLDATTNDTIGAAFNAYWIANDLIATSMATVKPLTDFMYAFEWAFDPDGNPETTSDVPDVINNSWGYESPGDTALCDSYASDMFLALETAGIAAVFSAGNDGPNFNTISEPQHINAGLVNVFSVGSIDPHDAGYPISNFSSRGPTTCPGTGSFKIKPEVVAPGQNVRSANGKTGYAEKSGTSMASPHVTGAILLLKEAFPDLPGEELLMSLYLSAHDLGETDEDNVYGNGLIDVKAAFDYLSQFYQPVPPVSTEWDIAIQQINHPVPGYICDTVVQPEIVMVNRGQKTIQQTLITYWYTDEPTHTYTWEGELKGGESCTVQLPKITAHYRGNKELFVVLGLNDQITEADPINNRRVVRFNIRGRETVPYFEDFETLNLKQSGWYVINPDGKRHWDTASTQGLQNSLRSVKMDCFHYVAAGSIIDDMISPMIVLPDTGNLQLEFSLAYQLFHPLFADTLIIEASTDFGHTYSHLLYYKGGAELTTNDTLATAFTPSDSSHWRREHIDLNALAGESILLRFRTIDDKGNGIYIDNIRVAKAGSTYGIEMAHQHDFSVYPQPATDQLFVEFSSKTPRLLNIQLRTLSGQVVYENQHNCYQNTQQIDTRNLVSGLYLLHLSGTDLDASHKVIIRK